MRKKKKSATQGATSAHLPHSLSHAHTHLSHAHTRSPCHHCVRHHCEVVKCASHTHKSTHNTYIPRTHARAHTHTAHMARFLPTYHGPKYFWVARILLVA